MTNEEIRRLVREATANIASPPQNTAACGETLLLLPAYTALPPKNLLAQLLGTSQIVLAGFGGRSACELPYRDMDNTDCVNQLLESLDGFQAVYLYAPGFALMKRLASLQDDELLIRILLQRLLLGKTAGICFNHDPARTPPALHTQLKEMLNTVSQLGFSIQWAPAPSAASEAIAISNTLLLEEDIVSLHRQGQRSLHLAQGGIVTPLALDKARELGMEILETDR